MGKKELTYMDRAAAVIADPANAVGRVRKVYGDGRDGALLLALYDNFPMSEYMTEPLWVEIDSLAVPLFIGSLELLGGRNSGRGMARFDDFDQERTVEMLVGKTLFCEVTEEASADDLAEEEHEWIGFELRDRGSGRRGVVKAFYDYPGNPLLGVDFDGREVLVPTGVIEVENARRKKLEGDLPEGLFEL